MAVGVFVVALAWGHNYAGFWFFEYVAATVDTMTGAFHLGDFASHTHTHTQVRGQEKAASC